MKKWPKYRLDEVQPALDPSIIPFIENRFLLKNKTVNAFILKKNKTKIIKHTFI